MGEDSAWWRGEGLWEGVGAGEIWDPLGLLHGAAPPTPQAGSQTPGQGQRRPNMVRQAPSTHLYDGPAEGEGPQLGQGGVQAAPDEKVDCRQDALVHACIAWAW